MNVRVAGEGVIGLGLDGWLTLQHRPSGT
jgi:hypothetical protein